MNKNSKSKFRDRLWVRRAALIAFFDFVCVLVAFFAALWIRLDFTFNIITSEYLNDYLLSATVFGVSTVIVFFLFNLYNSVWRFVGESELIREVLAFAILFFVYIVEALILGVSVPRSYYVFGTALSFLFTIGIRFSYRILRSFQFGATRSDPNLPQENIMIIGAGHAGKTLMHDIVSSSAVNTKIKCIIDDEPNKIGRILYGVSVVGDRHTIPEMVKSHGITKILFAIPNISPKEKSEILKICSRTGCKVQTLPAINQLISGDVSISNLRSVEITDLLGRDQIPVNVREILEHIKGRTVMVTGGGGSIGSELCRQIAKSSPRQLIIFDIYENNLYDIQLELQKTFPKLNLVALVGSVRNTARIDDVLKTYRPDMVFHAAAHKHVPLMETSPNEPIKNNVFGTLKMGSMAIKYGVKNFILISTDKAVNPTNIMGASKRLCEMVIQMLSRKSKTTIFTAVRFGNVLGSNGSVIPVFKRQIEQGGPVTVTHPDIIRYFMTISEAVSLVLQSSYYAKNGEIMVLDMGEPVKIADMAKNLIKLSGYEPDVDIMIEYTGLRPGEKLYEELLMAEEGLKKTANNMIFVAKPIEMDDDKFTVQLEALENAYKMESHDMKNLVSEIVPTYKPELI